MRNVHLTFALEIEPRRHVDEETEVLCRINRAPGGGTGRGWANTGPSILLQSLISKIDKATGTGVLRYGAHRYRHGRILAPGRPDEGRLLPTLGASSAKPSQ